MTCAARMLRCDASKRLTRVGGSGELFQDGAQRSRPGCPLWEVEPQAGPLEPQIEAVRIASGAAPVPIRCTQQLSGVEPQCILVILIHMSHSVRFSFNQRLGAGHVGKNIFSGQIDDAPEAGDQMRAA